MYECKMPPLPSGLNLGFVTWCFIVYSFLLQLGLHLVDFMRDSVQGGPTGFYTGN